MGRRGGWGENIRSLRREKDKMTKKMQNEIKTLKWKQRNSKAGSVSTIQSAMCRDS